MKKIDEIIVEHLGKDWFKVPIEDLSALQVLLDRLQEQGLSLRRSVWQVLAISLLNTPHSSIWLSQPTQPRSYVMDLIGLWGDLTAAADYYREYYLKNYPTPNIYWYLLLKNLREAVEASGIDSSNLPA